MIRGFLLTSSCRLQRERAIVLLQGKLESGQPFLVCDSRIEPRFWIALDHVERARSLGADVRVPEPSWKDFDGRSMAAVHAPSPRELLGWSDRLLADGVETYEADVSTVSRYLIDRGIRGSCSIEGPSREQAGTGLVFDQPQLGPSDWVPELRVLSLDIETDPQGRRLLSAAIAGIDFGDVFLLEPRGYGSPAGVRACPDERALLNALARRIREIDPDVITGWNVIDFDLAFLERHARRLGVAFEIGRGAGPLVVRGSSLPQGLSRAHVPGRVVLDGPQLLRQSFVRLEGQSLESASRQVLGRGKLITGPHRAQEILDAFEHDRAKLCAYNLEDARLVRDILTQLSLVPLAVERSRLTGLPIDRVSSSVAAFDFIYLSRLEPQRIVAPAREWPAGEVGAMSGGHVLDPAPGLYRNVIVLDFRSLYPSLIRTFNIDPLSRVRERGSRQGAIVAPNDAAFRRETGILPGMLEELAPRREAAIAGGDTVASQAIKILMNSFYGVLGTPACRFAHPDLANAVTGFGREVLLWTRGRITARGLDVLYGDTDSLFVRSGLDDPAAAQQAGVTLAQELEQELASWIRERWGVESRLELRFTALYLRLLLPLRRHGGSGARKRYAGLVAEPGGSRVVLTGLEAVRSDWTDLARAVQRELYTRLFANRPLIDYLEGVAADLRAGKLDDQLVYRKRLRKELKAYTESTPPHVAAARKMATPPRRTVLYVMTRNGPEPARERASPIDYEHYVERQLRAVAEPVLALLGIDFERAIGGPHQPRLF